MKPKIKTLQKVKFGKYTIEQQKDKFGKILKISINGKEALNIYDSFNADTTCFSFEVIDGKLPENATMNCVSTLWIKTPRR